MADSQIAIALAFAFAFLLLLAPTMVARLDVLPCARAPPLFAALFPVALFPVAVFPVLPAFPAVMEQSPAPVAWKGEGARAWHSRPTASAGARAAVEPAAAVAAAARAPSHAAPACLLRAGCAQIRARLRAAAPLPAADTRAPRAPAHAPHSRFRAQSLGGAASPARERGEREPTARQLRFQ